MMLYDTETFAGIKRKRLLRYKSSAALAATSLLVLLPSPLTVRVGETPMWVKHFNKSQCALQVYIEMHVHTVLYSGYLYDRIGFVLLPEQPVNSLLPSVLA